MIEHVPCVCVHRASGRWGCQNRRLNKTTGRRCVFDETHGDKHFLSLLHSVRSSSISKRLVILHTHGGWLYYEQLDNDRGGVAA